MSNYRPAYFRVASGGDPQASPAMELLAPENHHNEHQNHDGHQHPAPPPAGGTADPAEFVRQMLTKTSCCDSIIAKPIYCQLDILESAVGPDGMSKLPVWREKFRWVKYEEELELIGNRWSAPYIPVLSPFSVMEARKQLESGLTQLMTLAPVPQPNEAAEGVAVEIDVKGRDLKEIADDVETQLVATHGLIPGAAEEVKRALLAQRINFVQKKTVRIKVEGEKYDKKSERKTNKRYRKKVEKGAEACSILIGILPTLKTTVSVFLRLDRPVSESMLEIDVPVRFIYLLLGPRKSKLDDLVPVGKAVATLLVDEIFHKVAYLAEGKSELIAGVDEFLKWSSILPPIGCSQTDRIPPPEKKPNTAHRHIDGKSKKEMEAEQFEMIEGLDRTGKLFGGLIQDIKRRAPWYKSDYLDALHPQTIGSLFFIYFACIAPIITFGGMLSDATNGYLGAMESILSGLVCGVNYALFAGQPMTIMGSTGPVLVFETIVFQTCDRLHWEYLSFRWWIGMWTALFLLIAVALDLSFLVKYITRFTEESFALLIALIFIYEAFAKLIKIGQDYPVNRQWHPKHEVILDCSCVPNPNVSLIEVPPKEARVLPTYMMGNMTVANFSAFDYYSWDRELYWKYCEKFGGMWVGAGCGNFNVPDVFFFSCIIMIVSFFLSFTLKKARASTLFPTQIRKLISDFAVMIAVLSVTTADYLLDLHTPKLLIPRKFEPTLGLKFRSWVIHPFGTNPWYTSLIAIGPALLAVILLFLDQQITAVIVNRKENKMKKGCGYHLDLLVVAVCVIINTSLGLPWFVAATVLSINHVLSLRQESEVTAPGERPVMLGCRENRVTGFLVFTAIGLSSFMSPLLAHIPMPALYGVFLFMGFSSLDGLQIFNRFMLFFTPRKTQPDYKYLREVKLSRVHLFTAIQLFFFAMLWVVKRVNVISIGFPLMVLSLCFGRKLLDYIFTRHELKMLDDLWPEQRMEETIRLRRRSSRISTARDLDELMKNAEEADHDGKHDAVKVA